MTLARRSLAGSPAPAVHPGRRRRPRSRTTRFAVRTGAVVTTSLVALVSVPLGTAIAASAPTLTPQQASPGNTTSPAWTVVPADQLAVTECRITSGVATVTDWAPCSGTYTADLSARADGAYTLEARSTDLAGSASTSNTYLLDTTGPVAPTITSSPTSPAKSRTPAWSWTLPEGTGTCRLASSTTVVVDWSPCTSPRTFDLAGRPDGTYTFRVRATDAAGNPGAVATASYTLDTTGPAAPTVTVVTANPGRSTTVTWSWTGEAGATAQCRVLQDGVPMRAGRFNPCTTPHTEDLTGNPDGTYTLEVILTDAVGNPGGTGSASYLLDRVAPGAPTIDSGPGPVGNDTTPTYTFSGAGATYECRVDGPNGPGTFTGCTSPFTPTLSGGDGGYTVLVRALDAAGNASTAVSRAYTLDTVLPAAPSLSGPTGPSRDKHPVFTFTAEAGATTECRVINPAGAVSAWTGCTSPYTAAFVDGDGGYVLRVRATDQAGNTGTFAAASYDVDTSGPAAPSVLGPTGPSAGTTPAWTFTAEAGAGTECRVVGPGGPTVWSSCTSPVSRTLGQGDGSYTLEVRATDVAGNLGGTGTSPTYVLDTTAPSAPTPSGPPSPDNDTSVTFTFSAEAGTSTACRLVGPTASSAWTSCTSPVSHTLTQGDGTYTFQVRATDAANNVGPAAGVNYLLDTQAPGAPTVSGPASPGNSAAVSFTFSAEAGSTAECQLVGPSGTSGWTPCTSPAGRTLTQGDGAYSFRVRATDAAGNTGTTGSTTYRLDTAAPVAPALSGPASPGNQTAVSYTFNTEANATTVCRLTGPNGTSGWAACSSPESRTLGQGDGTYTFEVRATDQAGNTSPASSVSYVLDTVAPGVPTVAGPVGPSNDTTPTWTFSADAQAATECRVFRDGVAVSAWSACTSPTTETLSSGDGTYTLRVRATDLAGNTGIAGVSPDYVLDTQPPATPTVAGPTSPDSDTTVAFTFSSEPGATLECRLVTPESNGSWGACTSPGARTLVDGDGTYTFRVRATDAAGNTSAAGSVTYVLDTSGPAAPAVSGPTGPSPTASATWTFTTEASATTECRLVGPVSTTGWSACSSPETRTLHHGDGSYALEVRATDLVGNVGVVGRSPTYVLDTVAPGPPSLTGPASPGSTTTPTFTFGAEAGAVTECRLAGPTSTSAWAVCTSPRTPTLGQGDASYTFEVRATDAAGNVGAPATAVYVLDTAAPAVPSVSGPASPGNSAAVTFTFTADPGTTTECQLAGPAGTSAWAACTSPASLSLDQGDSTYTFRVRATDAAGNTSGAGSATYRLDTAAPARPSVNAPTSPDNDTAVTFTFSAEAGASVECRLVGPGGAGSWAACSSPSGRTLGQGDGTYVLEVRATDAAGNTSAVGSAGYVLDTTPPPAPTVTGPTGPSKVTTVAWSFSSVEAAVGFECRRLKDGSPVTAWVSCTSPRTTTLMSGDGVYVQEVRATDVAGNTGPVGSSPGFVLDTAAPAAPAVTAPASPSSNASVTFTFTAEAGASAECLLEGPASTGAWTPCTSPANRALGQGDGTYTFRVRVTDAAGNTSPVGSATYALDATKPADPVFTSTPLSPGQGRSPSWSFTLPADGIGQCQLSRGATVLVAYTSCASPYVADLTGQDGTYVVSVRAVDAAGNTSAAISSSYTLDTTGASAGTVSPPSGTASKDTTPTWTFTPEAGATTECQVLRGSTVIVPRAPCTSPFGADLSSAGDGTYTLVIWATDSAGNTGTPSTATYVLDTVAPLAPTITSGPPAVWLSRTPTWTFTTEPGATLQCRVTRDGSAPGAWTPCTSPYTADLTGLPDGRFDFEVRAIDAAGNVGPAASALYTLDTTPPPAPSLVSAPGSPSKVPTPAWAFSSEPGTNTECQVTGPLGVVDDWGTCTSPYTADLTDQPDGPYTFLVRATDPAGNTGAALRVDYVLDGTVPAAPTITAAPVGPARDRTPSWDFSGEAGATFTCWVTRGTVTVIARSACATRYTADLTAEPDGSYNFHVFATDVSDNTSATSVATYTLDLTAPAAPDFTRRPASPDNLRRPAWSWTGDARATASCQVSRGTTIVQRWTDCESPYVADLADARDGTYTLSVRLTDFAGNMSPTASSSYALDTTAPAAPRFTDAPASPGDDRTPTWSWTDEKGAQAHCLVSKAGQVIRDWAPCAPAWTFAVGGYGEGTYRLSVRVTDAAGNVSDAARTNYVLDLTPPPAPRPQQPEPTDNDGGPDGGSGGHPGNDPQPPRAVERPSLLENPLPPGAEPALKPTQEPDDDPGTRQLFSPQIPAAGDVPSVIGQVAVKSLEKPQFPLLLLVVVAIFLLVQNRIDRKDPKLAAAPVDAEPMLGFGPVVDRP